METNQKNGWRVKRVIQAESVSPENYPATRFFDQLCFIGDKKDACYLLETSEGLVLLDCLNPDQRSIDLIEQGIQDMGHNPEELIAILITHGHGDHYGHAEYFKEKYGCKVYMSEVDYAEAIVKKEGAPFPPWKCELDGYIEDMQVFSFGDVAVTAVLTPGHTLGCMSFLIPVTDEGRKHTMLLWGGTGIRPRSFPEEYVKSVHKIKEICEKMNVDGEISCHPFFDNTIERLDIINNIVDGAANPFIMTKDALDRYFAMLQEKGEKAIELRAKQNM